MNFTPFAAYLAKPNAAPSTTPVNRTRMRHDVVGQFGKLSVRLKLDMNHIGMGRTHTGTPVVMVQNGLHMVIANKQTGDILADFYLDPTRKYHKATLKTPN